MISAHYAAGSAWNWMAVHLPAVLGIAAAAAAYGAGLTRLAKANRRAALGPVRVFSFYAGLASLGVALLSPLDRLAEALFSAHMIQHLLIVLAASPLLVFGRPSLAFALSPPLQARRWIMKRAKVPVARRLSGSLSNPVVAGVLHAVVLWLWHLPGPYQAAIANPAVHAAEHVSFLLTALLFWSLVLAAGKRRGLAYLPAVMLVLGTALQSGALGVILAFASFQLYPVHAAGAAAWGLSPLEDQQLAGAIMWIPAGGVYLMTIVILLSRAFADVERRVRLAGEKAAPAIKLSAPK